MLAENIGEAADFLGRQVLEYLGPGGGIKIMTQDMLSEAKISIPFAARPTSLNDVVSLDDIICYRLAAFGDSSSKAVLVTVYFGAFRPLRLEQVWAEIDPDESPADLHQWLSCVSLVRSPDEAFHLLRLFVGEFDSLIRIKSKADGNPILTVEPRTPPTTAPTCQ